MVSGEGDRSDKGTSSSKPVGSRSPRPTSTSAGAVFLKFEASLFSSSTSAALEEGNSGTASTPGMNSPKDEEAGKPAATTGGDIASGAELAEDGERDEGERE